MVVRGSWSVGIEVGLRGGGLVDGSVKANPGMIIGSGRTHDGVFTAMETERRDGFGGNFNMIDNGMQED